MYSITDYGAMIADQVRMNAFARALRDHIGPQTIVADLGSGTGIFALLACRYGARRVYAIEPDDAIQLARDMAVSNGFADRIVFFQDVSTRVALPERVDVVVSDIGGALPWFQQHIPAIVDARKRFLAPGGTLIPACDQPWAAVVEAAELYERRTAGWSTNGSGLDMRAARQIATNTFGLGRVGRQHLLSEVRRWATLDYSIVEDPNVSAEVAFTVTREGMGHGLALGFDRLVSGDIGLSNAPDAPAVIRPEKIYGTVFLAWPEPVALAAGDLVAVDLNARLVGDDYVWSWNTRALGQGDTSREKARFAQSTFFGVPLSADRLKKRAASYTPVLKEEGKALRLVLQLMEGGATVGEIAAELAERFSGRFRSPDEALGYVGELSKKYG
jgi:protein arginine N-methyltransferase 1